MNDQKTIEAPVLIAGDVKTANTVAVCLLLAHQPVTLVTQDILQTTECISLHAADIKNAWGTDLCLEKLTITNGLNDHTDYSLAIGLTKEKLSEKEELIKQFEKVLSRDKIIAVNTESIALSDLQKCSKNPERIIGANWVEPAHTTYFLEVITNENNDQSLVQHFIQQAKLQWNKDPYLITTGHGIRARLLCALIREAFYLVEHGYVSFEDIDRACRNDAGYYLPFAGNFRYMDLMGTYIYGIVMKDMNPELTKQRHLLPFFTALVQQGFLGMENQKGFYEYKDGEVERWNQLSRSFSYQIRNIMEKYHSVI